METGECVVRRQEALLLTAMMQVEVPAMMARREERGEPPKSGRWLMSAPIMPGSERDQ